MLPFIESEEFLTNKQLKIFLKNNELIIDNLRERLFKLTGCRDFGNLDGMNGSCIECFYNDEKLFKECESFTFDKKKNLCYNKKKE